MNLGFDAAVLAECAKAPDINTYTANLLPKLKAVQEVVQENLRDCGVTNKAVYDRKAEQPSFALGCKVFLHDPLQKKANVLN